VSGSSDLGSPADALETSICSRSGQASQAPGAAADYGFQRWQVELTDLEGRDRCRSPQVLLRTAD
jgi:hypothetical protein